MNTTSNKIIYIILTVLMGLSLLGITQIISIATEINETQIINENDQIIIADSAGNGDNENSGAAGEGGAENPQQQTEQAGALAEGKQPAEAPDNTAETETESTGSQGDQEENDRGQEAPENTDRRGHISGFVGLGEDIGETADNDGSHLEAWRAPIKGVSVYLYTAEELWKYWALDPEDQRAEEMPYPFAVAETDEHGAYIFRYLPTGNYIAAVARERIGGQTYLPPLKLTKENKFATDVNNELCIAFTDYITLGEGQEIEHVNALMRLPDPEAGEGEETEEGEETGESEEPGDSEEPDEDEDPQSEELDEDEEPLSEEEPPGEDESRGISGFIWLDGDGTTDTCWDGIFDGNELPLVGWPVHLFAAGDLENPIAVEETENDGSYSFGNLPEGEYILMVDAGFDAEATRPFTPHHWTINLPALEIDFPLVHPTTFERNVAADRWSDIHLWHIRRFRSLILFLSRFTILRVAYHKIFTKLFKVK